MAHHVACQISIRSVSGIVLRYCFFFIALGKREIGASHTNIHTRGNSEQLNIPL